MSLVNLLLIFLAAVFYPGIIGRIKAFTAGRKAPSLWQPVYDLLRLLKKETLYSSTGSFIMQIATPVFLAALIMSATIIPFAGTQGLMSFEGDLVLVAYLLVLSRFIIILAAYDASSSFQGMGANREAFFSVLAEPAFFFLAGSMALVAGISSFNELFNSLYLNTHAFLLISLATVYILFLLMVVETKRVPVDDPRTHLELTMIHEVMVLDFSGIDLVLIHLGNWLKFALFGTLISNVLLNPSWNFVYKIVGFFIIQVILAVAIGLLESFRARNKMEKNLQWLLTIPAVAVVVFFAVLILTHKINLNL